MINVRGHKKMKNKKQSKKFLAALALGILVFSGMALSVAAMDNNNLQNLPVKGEFKEINNNPFNLINSANISVPSNFDYIDQMNKEFVDNLNSNEKITYMAGDSLKEIDKNLK